jgi:hypothetical protein
MASPAQLARTISEATGVPLATVVDIDRKLVKGGLRTKAGRGLSAARMQPLDAARLLTAILASPQANEAASAVARYAQTQVDTSRSSESIYGAAEGSTLSALAGRHNFVEALAALLASAADGTLASHAAGEDQRRKPSIEIFAFTRATRGRIRLAGLQSGQTASVEYVPADRNREGLEDRAAGDLEQSRRITERTVIAVATLLAEEAGDVGR